MQLFQIKNTDPTPLRLFTEIAKVPRPSGSEQKIADFLVTFATENGFSVYRDAAHNVLIRKPATKGREGEPPLLLQAHSDMVAEKNSGVEQDFEKDPITLYTDGKQLFANGTTLGADDGFGIALILAALLEAPSHPALECLITTSEEVGMEGAMAFDYSLLSARRMVNLDSDVEQEIIVGCCGGLTTTLALPLAKEQECRPALCLRVEGLCGGHSGSDIHRGRANALSLMAAWLQALALKTPFGIALLEGGDKSNAIPRECRAVITVSDTAAARAALEEARGALQATVQAPEDAAVRFTVEECEAQAAFDSGKTQQILRLLSLRGGVIKARPDGAPQLSRNIAAVHSTRQGISLTLSTRSADQTEIDFLRLESEVLAAELNASVTHTGAYPGWESSADSDLVRAWQAAASAEGITAAPTVIHAGLECGLFSEKLKGLCAISVGCNIQDLHTPAERMELASFARIYRVLLRLLAAI